MTCLLYTSVFVEWLSKKTGEEVGMEGKLKISFIGDSPVSYTHLMGIVVPYVDRAFGIVCCVVAFLFRILGKMIVLREKLICII